ncbi:MAG: glycogen debranching protein GlgX [Planctomycetes bacterium]|nr:glycogen debranching protein GlgX [Planctomycetota bacterium]
MRVWPGCPYPLGATWTGEGVNFALFSEHATAVELCLFDRPGDAQEAHRVPLRERTHAVWHACLPDLRPGALYGYRVHGPWAPADGHRFNPHKLLLDPYARALSGTVDYDPRQVGSAPGDPDVLDPRDSAATLPRGVVVDPAFDWGDDRPPRTPWHRTVIYECHVKGTTMRHPEVPDAHRGRYLGLASPPVVAHLQALGVTAVEVLPAHALSSEPHLVERGKVNYWGYNSVGYFAPEVRYASGGAATAVHEFKAMVKGLHAAGIEVILDVVYNHTAEGGGQGPTLSFRGIDNAAYYHLDPHDRRRYVDYTGCGNTLNFAHPYVLQLLMDSLRYWVQEMHVDGFRFDLAPAMARGLFEMNRLGRFFAFIQQDPVLSQVKLIAEPWDLGQGGYQIGNFPYGWAEWNGRYRDTVRRYWRGDHGQLGELASRVSGSSDLYGQHKRRAPTSSINYVTCHDGFTLADLVTYERKHNEANGEENRDGSDANWSRNWGVEGPTTDPEVNELRGRMERNLLATLAFSQGVPMLLGGDEFGRSQRGNNNAYCQDNELSWIDWRLDDRGRRLLAFTRRLLELRSRQPVLRRRAHFSGRPMEGDGSVKDVTWVRRDGREMTQEDWHRQDRFVGMLIQGAATDEVDERGELLVGDTLLMLLNSAPEPIYVTFPLVQGPGDWRELVCTARPEAPEQVVSGPGMIVPSRSLLLLSHHG